VTKPASRAPLLYYSRRRTRCQMPRNQDGGSSGAPGRPSSARDRVPASYRPAQRVVSSLGVFKVLNPTWPPAAQQCAGQGPDRVCHGRVLTRRVLRPATKIGMRLPTARGGETRSLSRALAVLGAPTQWRSVFGSVKDTKGPSLPYARACAVVPRLPEPSSGDASLYVVCMLRGMAFAGDFHVHPQRYFFYKTVFFFFFLKVFFFFFFYYRSQNNTLGRGAPAARPPWRPSVPVPSVVLRISNVFEPLT